ncbi:MAG: hypothetical protein KC635_26990 [Myxococcales bacterium]|nr:hypothetical protein [Myxococcales bacterium]
MRNLTLALATAAGLTLTAGACGTTPKPTGETPPVEAPKAPAGEPLVLPPAPLKGIEEHFTDWATALPLPAISADGEVVAVSAADDDGARGNANMAIELRRVKDDLVIETLPILGPEEVEQVLAESSGGGDEAAVIDAQLGPVVAQRVQEANAALAKRRWIPVTEMLVGKEPGEDTVPDDELPFARGPFEDAERGLVVTWKEPRFAVTQRGKALVAADRPGWVAPIEHMCGEEEMQEMTPEEIASDCTCSNPAYLDDARLSPEHGALLVKVAYYGTDTCWEPDSVWHVVALPGFTK